MKKCVVFFVLFLLACSQPADLPVPEMVGDLHKSSVDIGEKADNEINQLHGIEVAAEQNAIVHFGENSKEMLYISRFSDDAQARKAFDDMIKKIAESDAGVFQHLMPIKKYGGDVFMTIGMGHIHYIYVSGPHVLWLQTRQSLGLDLPAEMIQLYPVREIPG